MLRNFFEVLGNAAGFSSRGEQVQQKTVELMTNVAR
jgi:hypothetical protein